MKELYIWGTGCGAGELLREQIDIEDVAAFVESRVLGESFMGRPVISPAELSRRSYALILVSSRSSHDIRERCIEEGIDLSRVLFLKNYQRLCDMNEDHAAAEALLGREKCAKLLPEYRIVPRPERDPGLLPARDLEDDWVRLKSLELVCERLRDVDGCAAELGVYKGGFARCINYLMPQRKLYLFDSFQGFDERELESEGCSEGFAQAHMNTSAAAVYERMPHKESVELRPGLFPESLKGLEERFAFVSLDVDLEQSTYCGLSYFVPRMNRGGYIFLHDYNSHLSGVKRALLRYEQDSGQQLCLMPLCDFCGTIVICM